MKKSVFIVFLLSVAFLSISFKSSGISHFNEFFKLSNTSNSPSVRENYSSPIMTPPTCESDPITYYYCYPDNADSLMVFYSVNPGVSTIRVNFVQAEIFQYDVMTIYDGPDTSYPILFEGDNLTGLTFESSGDYLSLRVESDSDMSCETFPQPAIIFEILCGTSELDGCMELPAIFGCTDPDAFNFSENATCDNNTCLYPNCTNYTANVEYCFGNSENTSTTYQAIGLEPTDLQVYFNIGAVEAGFDLIIIYDGPDLVSPVLVSSDNLTGQMFTSSSGFLTIQIVTDSSVSCETSILYPEISYIVFCGVSEGNTCSDPSACNYSELAVGNIESCVYPDETLVAGKVFYDINNNSEYNPELFGETGLAGRPVIVAETNETLYTDADGLFYYNVPENETRTFSVMDSDEAFYPAPEALNIQVTGQANCNTQELFLPLVSDQELFANISHWNMNINPDIHCNNGFHPGVLIHNTGNTPFDAVVTITFSDVLAAYPIEMENQPSSILPGEVIFTFANIMPDEQELFQIFIDGPGVEFINQTFLFNLNVVLISAQGVQFEASSTLEPMVVCAYDPNDKTATPEGYSEPHFILNDQEIVYRIRFQNTGNFPAEYIIIADQLDLNTLDINTFQPLVSSHNYMACLNPNGQVEFKFYNIFLPDSSSDLTGSQGFVDFRIRTLPGLSPGTEINNTAYIYFEENPPIITNTTWHTIYDCSELELLDGSETAFCPDGNASFEIPYPYVESLEWSINGENIGNGNTIEFTELESGDYTIELIASNPLCSATSNASIHMWEAPMVSISENQALITATAGYENYQWYFEGSIIDGVNQQTYVAEESGNYSVAITDENGCTALSDELFVLVIGIDEINTGFIALYPNPFQDFCTIKFSAESNNRFVRLLDYQGKEVLTLQAAFSNQFILHRTGLAAGIYIIEISEGEELRHFNLMVE